MLIFSCCQSLTFGVLPFVGSLEIWFLMVLVAVFVVLAMLTGWVARRIGAIPTAVAIACLAVLPRLMWPYLLSLDKEGAVKGWLTALDMARIDDTSSAVKMWARY